MPTPAKPTGLAPSNITNICAAARLHQGARREGHWSWRPPCSPRLTARQEAELRLLKQEQAIRRLEKDIEELLAERAA